MTTKNIGTIMAKLDSMGEQVDALQADVKSIRAEVERVRGIWWAANWTLRLLGVAGLGALINWLSQQGK